MAVVQPYTYVIYSSGQQQIYQPRECELVNVKLSVRLEFSRIRLCTSSCILGVQFFLSAAVIVMYILPSVLALSEIWPSFSPPFCVIFVYLKDNLIFHHKKAVQLFWKHVYLVLAGKCQEILKRKLCYNCQCFRAVLHVEKYVRYRKRNK